MTDSFDSTPTGASSPHFGDNKNRDKNPVGEGFKAHMQDNGTAPSVDPADGPFDTWLESKGFTKDQAEKFKMSLMNMMVNEIKAQESKMEEANRRLRESEGSDN